MPKPTFFGTVLRITPIECNVKGARVTRASQTCDDSCTPRVTVRLSEPKSESLKWETALGLKYAELGEITRRRRARSGALKWLSALGRNTDTLRLRAVQLGPRSEP